jgi:SAM-dependent methyltransferase
MTSFREVWRGVREGKGIWRILFYQALGPWRDEIRGVVLDLASGARPGYARLLGSTDRLGVTRIRVDYDPAYSPNVVADLTRGVPFRTGSADVVIVSGFLNILGDPTTFLGEVRRVLKRRGTLLLTTNLVYPYDPEPTDYWRFTEQGVARLLEEAGFTGARIEPLGGRWSSAAYLLEPFLRPRPIVPTVVYWTCMRLDAWADRHFRWPRCPIGYIVLARVIADALA